MKQIQNKTRIFLVTDQMMNKWDELIIEQQNLLMDLFSNHEILLPLHLLAENDKVTVIKKCKVSEEK